MLELPDYGGDLAMVIILPEAVDGLAEVEDALQRTFVEVNEAGTEAATATLFEAKTMGMPGRFYADHPFLFLIRDRGSGTILILGRLTDPRPPGAA